MYTPQDLVDTLTKMTALGKLTWKGFREAETEFGGSLFRLHILPLSSTNRVYTLSVGQPADPDSWEQISHADVEKLGYQVYTQLKAAQAKRENEEHAKLSIRLDTILRSDSRAQQYLPLDQEEAR